MLEIIGCIALVVLGYLVWSWLSGVTPDSFEQFVAHEAHHGKYK